jgi:hypothetical protein
MLELEMPFGPVQPTFIWPTYDEYCKLIDVVATVLGLDLMSGDIKDFKKEARLLISENDPRGPQFFLNMLSPANYGRREENGSITVLDGNLVLQPWTIANWHCPKYREYIVKIVIDRHSTRLYAKDNDHVLSFLARINPHRNVQDDIEGSLLGYKAAARLVLAITGLQFVTKGLATHTETITITREPGGSWEAQFSRRLALVPQEQND